jgi:hypothetical protein
MNGQCWVLSVFPYSHRSSPTVLRLVSGLRVIEEKDLYVEGTSWKVSIRQADVFSRGGASCIDHPIACGVRDWPPYISLCRSLRRRKRRKPHHQPGLAGLEQLKVRFSSRVVALGHVVKEGST